MSAYAEVTGHQPDLQKMTKGQPVLEAQQLLDKHCYGPEPDGYFGDITERCLNQFKGAYGMVEDGLIDQTTWAVLNVATTSDQPIGTQEPFSIDLLTLFSNDGQYTAVITVGPDTATIDYDVVNGQVFSP